MITMRRRLRDGQTERGGLARGSRPRGLKPAARCRRGLPGAPLLVLLAGIGCTGPSGGGGWLNSGDKSGEQWTIRCLSSNAPEHAQLCNNLAGTLRRTEGIRPSDVRVESGATVSRICYGEYARTRSSRTGELSFPSKMQKDLEFIRSLGMGNQKPFDLAVPQPIAAGPVTARHKWDVRKIRGTDKLTLLIAVFYNTPTFDQRKEAAEQYVQLLRDDGCDAYLLHEELKSYVSVGSFDRSQLVQQPDGRWWYGDEVEASINSRPEEFKYLTENGHRMRHYAPDGQPMLAPSQLVPVPHGGSTGLWTH